MEGNNQLALNVASSLLQINAIKLNVKNPFTWASGIKSPIYCDNRQILSYPEIRHMVATSLAGIIADKYPECEVVAGVATGAIAHGVLVAERLNKPFVYVRSAPKGHGLSNRIEGTFREGAGIVVVEDLVSTGKSSLEAVQSLRDAGGRVLGMVAIFTYELPAAANAMKKAECPLDTLSHFTALLSQAVREHVISSEEAASLNNWRNNPEKAMYDAI